MYFCIFTVRNSSCGNVMFSQASVTLSMGVCIPACTGWEACGRPPPRPDGHCSRRFASYWNAFLYIFVAAVVTVLIMMAITFLDKIIFGMYLHHVHIVVVLG